MPLGMRTDACPRRLFTFSRRRQQIGTRNTAQRDFYALFVAADVLDRLKREVDVIGSRFLRCFGVSAQDFLGDRKMLLQ